MDLFSALVLLLTLGTVLSETCTTPNGEEARCIPVRNCSIFIQAILAQDPTSLDFIQKSQCGYSNGSPLVCCGSRASYTNTETTTTSIGTVPSAKPDYTSKMLLLPSKRYCGYQHFDDYFHTGNTSVTSIDEYPWLAGLIHKYSDGSRAVLCTGSLISNRYVLTTAHCIITRFSELIGVRLGEYNIVKADDCIKSEIAEEECTDAVVEYGIEEQIINQGYNSRSKQHDIALLRLNRTVTYSDYIRPICLPFPGTKIAQVGDKLSLSGWGKLNFTHQSSADVKKKIFAELLPVERCIETYKEDKRVIITEHQICTSEDETVSDISCQGDSGGPLVFSDNRNQWHQEGIVSYGKGCGSINPSVNVNVVKYLDWILENIRK